MDPSLGTFGICFRIFDLGTSSTAAAGRLREFGVARLGRSGPLGPSVSASSASAALAAFFFFLFLTLRSFRCIPLLQGGDCCCCIGVQSRCRGLLLLRVISCASSLGRGGDKRGGATVVDRPRPQDNPTIVSAHNEFFLYCWQWLACAVTCLRLNKRTLIAMQLSLELVMQSFE